MNKREGRKIKMLVLEKTNANLNLNLANVRHYEHGTRVWQAGDIVNDDLIDEDAWYENLIRWEEASLLAQEEEEERVKALNAEEGTYYNETETNNLFVLCCINRF